MASTRKVGADEALHMGLVSRLWPQAELMEAVRAYARDLVEHVSPRSMAVIKRQVWEAQFQTLNEAMGVADEEMRRSFSSADFKEGVAHFLEKRPPSFTGR